MEILPSWDPHSVLKVDPGGNLTSARYGRKMALARLPVTPLSR